MITLGYILATAVAVATGFCLLALLRWPGLSTRPIYEQLALSYLVGLPTIALETYMLGYLGVRASLLTLLPLQLVPIGLLLVCRMRSKDRAFFRMNMTMSDLFRRPWWQWLLIVLIVSKLTYVATMNATSLARSSDAFKCALGLAKATYETGNHLYFTMPGNYPKLPGLMIHWFGAWHHEWNELAINGSHFNYYLALLLLFYANLRVRIGVSGSVVGVYLLSMFPILLAHAVMVGYVDLPMAIYVSFAGIYAYRYAADGAWDDLVIAAIFTLLLPAIKNEGLVPYFFIASYGILAAVLYRSKRARPAVIWGVTGALVLIAVSFVVALEVAYGEVGPPLLHPNVWYHIRPGNHLDEVIKPLLVHFTFDYNNWMVVGPLAAFALAPLCALFWNRAELVIGVYSMTLLVCFLYLFCFGGAYEWLILGTAVNRSFLQIIPAILFAVVLMTTLRCTTEREVS